MGVDETVVVAEVVLEVPIPSTDSLSSPFFAPVEFAEFFGRE